MTKTIQNTNFVQFMHEVVDAVASGYTLDYEPSNAPESTPSYKVTLIKQLQATVEAAKNLEEVVEAFVTQEAVKDLVPVAEQESNIATDTTEEQTTPSKPQAGRPVRGTKK